MKKSKFLRTAFLIMVVFFSLNDRVSAQKDTVKIGAFIISLYDFDLADNSFVCDFWYWALYKNKDLDFRTTMEIAQSKNYQLKSSFVTELPGSYWYQANVKADVKKNWNVKNFPFDEQEINVIIESTEGDSSALVFISDEENSKIDPKLHLDEWTIKSSTFKSFSSDYSTTFGNPDLKGSSVYPGFKMSITIARKYSYLILFKLITGVIVAFIISCSVFFFKPYNIDPRFQLCVGGLFATVGNKYIVEGIVPSSNTLTLIDNIHNVTLVYILLIILLSILSLAIFEKKKVGSVELSQKLDMFSFFCIFSSYAVIITSLVFYSIL